MKSLQIYCKRNLFLAVSLKKGPDPIWLKKKISASFYVSFSEYERRMLKESGNEIPQRHALKVNEGAVETSMNEL